MSRHVALLRGINVRGNKRIAMSDLRSLLESLGYGEVATLLQSGNALFRPDPGTSPETLAAEIEEGIRTELGMSVRVLIRTAGDLAGVVSRNPLGAEPENGSRYFVAFLSGAVDRAGAKEIEALVEGDDRIWFDRTEAYAWCPSGFSVMANAAITESRLGVAVTVRNWNTVTKLARLSAD